MKKNARFFHEKISFLHVLTLLILVFLSFRLEATETYAGATKGRMHSLKTALINYQMDVGFFPNASNGTDDEPDAYFFEARSGLGFASSTNCLLVNDVSGFSRNGMDEAAYKKRWKGPYVDCEPEEFMTDCWGMPLIYIRHRKGLYLWSAGNDGKFDDFNKIITSTNYGDGSEEDDIVVKIKVFKNSVENKNMETLVKEANLKSKRKSSNAESGRALIGNFFKLLGLD